MQCGRKGNTYILPYSDRVPVRTEKELSISAASLKGTRERQEDYLLYSLGDGRLMAVVCDGMGGMDNGDTASRAAAEMLLRDLEKARLADDMFPYFKEEMEKLDDAVFGLRHPDGSRMKAGSTVVSVLLDGDKLHWFSVGDSRLYLLKGRTLSCLTKTHNYAAVLEEKKKQGLIDEGWYRKESRKGEQLTSYLGMGIAEEFDYGRLHFPGRQGERLLLCTDGLYRTVPHGELVRILQHAKSVESISQALKEAVSERNCPSQDNATWIVIGREET